MTTPYINKIAPKHDRTSCTDENLYNAAYGLDDFDGKGRCYRCTLIAAAQSNEVTDEMVNQASLALLGKEIDNAPGVDWQCSRHWTINKLREKMRKALTKVLGEPNHE